MSWTDRTRLDPSTFRIDPRMRAGYYTDQYFLNVREVLSRLAGEGYRFAGGCGELARAGVRIDRVEVGNIELEMQYFTKRRPFAVACGVDHAVAILKECTGCFDADGGFRNTADRLEIEAVHDGARLAPWVPALKVRGRYRDFAVLETPALGVLARGTRIATNTYQALSAAAGRPVFMFGARFDVPEAQAGDGYAYRIGVERYNADNAADVPAMITSAAQGSWWAARGGGTTSHSFVLSFLKDTTEATLQFARLMPADVKRVALVDTNNDCIGDSLRCATAFFKKWWELKSAARAAEAEKYVLYGVRCDTAGELRDVSVEPTGDPARDLGVVPQLVSRLRAALDNLHTHGEVAPEAAEQARRYFRDIKIVASGGFDAERIARFTRENVPVDVYGVGSFLMGGQRTDFTADVVRVRIDGRWLDMAKVGRKAIPNPDLEPVP